MNGIICKAYLVGIYPTKQPLRFDIQRLKWSGGNTTLSKQQVDEFKKTAPAEAIRIINNYIKPALIKAGFIYDTKLFKDFKFETNRAGLHLTCKIIFTDNLNEGKTAFTKSVKKTGLLNTDLLYLEKPYGKI